jgi:hypothetical protein
MRIQNRQVAGLLLQFPAAAFPGAWSEARRDSAGFKSTRLCPRVHSTSSRSIAKWRENQDSGKLSNGQRVWAEHKVTGKRAHAPLNQSLMLSRTRWLSLDEGVHVLLGGPRKPKPARP